MRRRADVLPEARRTHRTSAHRHPLIASEYPGAPRPILPAGHGALARASVDARRLVAAASAQSGIRLRVTGVRASRDRCCVDVSAARRSAAMERLPLVHAQALKLVDAGLHHEAIAERLGIERVAVGPLLEVAAAKLAALLEAEKGGP